jgi:aryl-alcohol dehydrogenase-like predicted oxidoreductase
VYGDADEAECRATVHEAVLTHGINFIDTSPYYGETKSETMLGKCLQGLPRDSYYLATKLGRYGDEDFDFRWRGAGRRG